MTPGRAQMPDCTSGQSVPACVDGTKWTVRLLHSEFHTCEVPVARSMAVTWPW